MAEFVEESENRVGEGAGVQPVDYVLSAALVDDQIGLAENREVTGYCRLGKLEVVDDLTHTPGVSLQQPEDLSAGFVGQGLEKLAQLPVRKVRSRAPGGEVLLIDELFDFQSFDLFHGVLSPACDCQFLF